GAFLGGPGYGLSTPGPSTRTLAGGLFAGFGGGPFFTNATHAGQLAGPFNTYSFNLGIGPIKGGVQYAFSGGTWIISMTFGPGGFISGSSYPTYSTTTGKSGC